MIVRWAFIDLTAGPFTWGPTVGGEGVRVEGSLPSVDNSFGKLSGGQEGTLLWSHHASNWPHCQCTLSARNKQC
jgi:hypothetical protein